MKRSIISLATMAVFLVIGGSARAGQISSLNVFTSGATSSAATMNANFTAIQTAVNDNDTRLTGMPGIEFNYIGNTGSLTTTATSYGSIILTAPSSGWIHVQLSGWSWAIGNSSCTSYSSTVSGSSTAYVDESPVVYYPFFVQYVSVVSAGSYTYYFCAYKSGTNSASGYESYMTATFYPQRY